MPLPCWGLESTTATPLPPPPATATAAASAAAATTVHADEPTTASANAVDVNHHAVPHCLNGSYRTTVLLGVTLSWEHRSANGVSKICKGFKV